MTGQPATGGAIVVPEQKTYFDSLADLFAVFAADTDPIYRDWLEATVPHHGGRAVDLGCGSGRFADLLAARYDEVLGVDIAAQELELARTHHRQANVRFEHRSLLHVTPKVDGRFDLVFSVNTVHHLRAHEVVLPHLRSLLAPAGQLVLVDIVNPGPWESLDWHVREAFADAEESYRQRSRDHRIAATVLELRLHPAWLEHVTTNIPLTHEQFRRQYGAAFPGADFTDLHKEVTGVHWKHPSPDLSGGGTTEGR